MTALLLAPHNDDAELFASFLILKHRPRVIVCLKSQVQQDRYGITAATREAETTAAMRELDVLKASLGCLAGWRQWHDYPDTDPDWDAIKSRLAVVFELENIEHVFAPALEDDGHEHHNRIGALALEVFGPDRVTSYLTYTRTGGRSTNGVEVVPEPDWIERKHRALACYRSQIAEPSCRPWFMGGLAEYVVE